MTQVGVRILNRREDIRSVIDAVERFAAANGIGSATLHDVSVVLDEALANIIAYGFEPGRQSEISIQTEYEQGTISIVIEDQGRPFDPTQAPDPDTVKPLQSRQAGGLGIHFMRSLMDEVSYSRLDGMNRLRLIKRTST